MDIPKRYSSPWFKLMRHITIDILEADQRLIIGKKWVEMGPAIKRSEKEMQEYQTFIVWQYLYYERGRRKYGGRDKHSVPGYNHHNMTGVRMMRAFIQVNKERGVFSYAVGNKVMTKQMYKDLQDMHTNCPDFLEVSTVINADK